MGYATTVGPCGCIKTRLMGDRDIYIKWEVCSDHYNSEIDDKMILEAAKNFREHSKSIQQKKL